MNVHTRHRRSSRGFTLAEVLVVLAIIAIMAAVLMPVLVTQLRKGDIGRIMGDMTSIRTGIETFMADVRRIPGDLTHLARPISISDTDIRGTTYPPGLVNRWRGPYIDQQQLASDDDRYPTGFGGRIVPALDTIVSEGVTWARVRIEGLIITEFNDIDLEFDGDPNSSTGRFRFDGTVATFLAVPVH